MDLESSECSGTSLPGKDTFIHLPNSEFFSKINYFIVGYFDPVVMFLIIKINIFRGDLSDIAAKTASLLPKRAFSAVDIS